MKSKLINIILLTLFLSLSMKCATIKGIVTEYDTHKAIASADILLIEFPTNGKMFGARYLATTNKKGFYILKNIPIGKYEVHVSKYYNENTYEPVHYRDLYDTLNIIDDNSIIILNVKLKSWAVYIDTVKSIEKYHDYFKTLKPTDVLKIRLDSLTFSKRYWKLYSTFYNKTDSIIYVIKELECLRLAEPVIMNSKGKMMKRNMVSIDCMGKSLPDSSDIIKIFPHDSANYSPVTIMFHNFKYYPKDIYSIKLKYKYKRRKTLPGAFANPKINYEKKLRKQIYYFNIALRGDYTSDDSLIFNNSKVIKK